MDTVEKILTLSPNITLLILFGLICGAIVIGKNWKKIKSITDTFYNTRKKNEKYREMLVHADEKVTEYEETLDELNEDVGNLKNKISEYDTENHKHWDVSIEYRKKYDEQKRRDEEKHIEIMNMQKQLADAQLNLTNAVTTLTHLSTEREHKIEALMCACRNLLASDLNTRYQRYLALGYVPADEYDEFVAEYQAYRSCNGNSTVEAKYNYIMKHIPVKVVESRPVLKVN